MVRWVTGAALLALVSAGALLALGGWPATSRPGSAEHATIEARSDGSSPSHEAAPGETTSLDGDEPADTGDNAAKGAVAKGAAAKPATPGKSPKDRAGDTAESEWSGRGPRPGGRHIGTVATSVDLVVSSFNVLGSSHTDRKGGRPGFAAGATRAGWAAQLVAGHDVDIVGFQELQADQMRVLMGALDGYGIFPGPSLSWREAENSIMWRSDRWRLMQTSTVAIPYFGGRMRQMPYIRLRSRETGTDIWVANFHNPASTPRWGDNSRWRAEATRRQIALANALRSRTGLPVVFTGDFNARDSYFCPLVAHTALESPTGGSADKGACSPPASMNVDWVFATPEIEWVSSRVDRGPLVRRTSDHPMVLGTGRLTGVDPAVVTEASKALARMERLPGRVADRRRQR